ncbi:AhpC/TSA family protein [Chitinophaga horti]|uniref:AhpC/TSA family protein n=1 Tax=Chitinophaga horti TaxID=2920382 RepID=A0ABY6IZ38_9BACT|nr:TlpA disulfide reductase family protein [Chitinophaga horti]UYQ92663.1 AhpC/TSA family protein [Chitinophaga horti]
MNKTIGLLLVSSLFTQALYAQKTFQIKGDLQDTARDGQKVSISYYEGASKMYKSAVIKDGKFTIDGQVTEPTYAAMSTGIPAAMRKENPWVMSEQTALFIEGGDITVTGKTLEGAVIKATGKAQADYLLLKKQLKPFADRQRDSYNAMLHAVVAKDTVERNRLKVINERSKAQIDSVEVAFLTSHPASYVTLELFRQRVNAISLTKEKDKLSAWYKALSAPMKQTLIGKQLNEQISSAFKLAPGNPSRDFTLKDTLGNPIALSSFRGKYVLLDFWASWCMPCRAENPAIKKAYARFKDKNFEVLGVSLERPGDRKAWVAAIQKDELPWKHVAPLEVKERDDVTKLYGITSIPMNFLIDPNGKIIAVYLRGEELMKKLEEIL